MDQLKAILLAQKGAKQELFGGRKVVKNSELEEAKLKKLREEEANELQEKEAKRRKVDAGDSARGNTMERKASDVEQLDKLEVIRRLRLLDQPATLFGEEDSERLTRLRSVQESFQADDEHAGGGQQTNLLLQLQREAKGKAAQKAAAAAAQKQEEAAKLAKQKERELAREAEGAEPDEEGQEEEDATMASFKRAAQIIKEKREEDKMTIDERIHKYLSRWCEDWRRDLDARSPDIKASGPGHQATIKFEETMVYMKPLFRQLKRGTLIPEMRAGLWIIVQDIQGRNYLHAVDIYTRLAIGNAPWPIGVTSVGIHERSSREKISHVMNGAAHIMNDEATRKYLQALKRLLTFVQRMYPTDPSRSVDFDASHDAGRGSTGGGSDKTALLDAERRGENRRTLALPAAPHFVDRDGSIMVPPKWENIVSKAAKDMGEPVERP